MATRRDSLSFAAQGELPRQATSTSDEFAWTVLDLIAQAELHDEVFWHCTGGTKAPEFLVNCSDFFYWGCADCEAITPANVHYLREAIAECEAIPNYEGVGYIGSLFCAKVRGLRPQGCTNPKDAAVRALFDACGPKREINIANPHHHPDDGGAYAYKREAE